MTKGRSGMIRHPRNDRGRSRGAPRLRLLDSAGSKRSSGNRESLNLSELIYELRRVRTRDCRLVELAHEPSKLIEQRMQFHARIETQACDKNTCSWPIREKIPVRN